MSHDEGGDVTGGVSLLKLRRAKAKFREWDARSVRLCWKFTPAVLAELATLRNQAGLLLSDDTVGLLTLDPPMFDGVPFKLVKDAALPVLMNESGPSTLNAVVEGVLVLN